MLTTTQHNPVDRVMMIVCLLAAIVLLSAFPWRQVSGQTFDSGHCSFEITCDGVRIPYEVMCVSVLPAQEVDIDISKNQRSGSFRLEYQSGTMLDSAAFSWTWKAPQTVGLYRLEIVKGANADSILLNVFVMVPFKDLRGEYLNGYRIGKYPLKPYKGLPTYKHPSGFVEVTESNRQVQVSPHFTLEQFLCKQEGDYPKYLVLREELLLKLEMILTEVNEQGISCNSFNVMSGYRTPYYNEAIGNVKYSRHQWGGAADIFVDEDPRDGFMDDLNRDGQIDWKDAAVVYDIVDSFYGDPRYSCFVGGLGRYKKTVNHGPFVHVDVRGFRARWGD